MTPKERVAKLMNGHQNDGYPDDGEVEEAIRAAEEARDAEWTHALHEAMDGLPEFRAAPTRPDIGECKRMFSGFSIVALEWAAALCEEHAKHGLHDIGEDGEDIAKLIRVEVARRNMPDGH